MSEELQIIMNTISQLGQAGKEAFIWWLVVNYLLHYLAVTVILCVVSFALVRIVKHITAMSYGNQLGSELCALLNVKDRDNSSWDNEYSRAELKAQVLNKVRAMSSE